MAEEKKDVIVPSEGNRSLQPGDTLRGPALNNKEGYQGGGGLRGPASDPNRPGQLTPSSLNAKLNGPALEYRKDSLLNHEGLNAKLNGPVGEHMAKVRGSTLLDKPIPPTPKKSPSSGSPTYHRGINSSGVNSRMKNSSFGRGVPFSANADYGPMWKHTTRLASVAIGNGESEATSLGLYHSPFNLNGFTMQGFAFNGAMPHVSTQSTIKGMQSTFHIAQDQDA